MLHRAISNGIRARGRIKTQDLLGEPNFRLVRVDEPPSLLVGGDSPSLVPFAFLQLKEGFEKRGFPTLPAGFNPETSFFGGIAVDRFLVVGPEVILGDAIRTEGGFSRLGFILAPKTRELTALFLEVLGASLPAGLPPIEAF